MTKIIVIFFSKSWKYLLLILALTFISGEIYFHLPGVYPVIKYSTDSTLGHIFMPNQQASVWLGKFSVASPKVTINSFGFRGKEIDWNKDSVLTLGSSEVFGLGIADSEVWSYLLEEDLTQNGENLQVINGGVTGYGPYHSLHSLYKVLEKTDLKTIIVRVSVADDKFLPPPTQRGINSNSGLFLTTKKLLQNNAQFLRFLVNKSQSQIHSINKALTPFFLTHPPKSIGVEFRQQQFIENNKSYWESMVCIATDKNIPLIFLIVDPGEINEQLVFSFLKSAFSDLPDVSVLLLGLDSFDLSCVPKNELKRIIKSKLTMKYDPHANALQHDIISANIYEHIKENSLINGQ
jgi:hypothetical protein